MIRGTLVRSIVSRLLRRSVLLLTLLGFVSSMLGWAHASCGATMTAPAATASAAMAGMDMGMDHGDDPPATDPCDHGAPAGTTPTGAACVLAAHCAQVVPPTLATVVASSAPLHVAPAALDDATPIAPATEPDSPPPRG